MKRLIFLLILLALEVSFIMGGVVAHASETYVILKRDMTNNGIYLRSVNAVDGDILTLARYDSSGALLGVVSTPVANIEGITTDTESVTSYQASDKFAGFLWHSLDFAKPVCESVSSVALEIERPALWLDAADADSVVLENGKVRTWTDKSGHGRSMNQATAANQPAYVSGEYIQTNGSKSAPTYLENAVPFMAASTQQITIFMATEFDSLPSASSHIIAEGSLSSNSPSYNAYLSSTDGNGGLIIRKSATATLTLPNGYWKTGKQLHVITDTKSKYGATSYSPRGTVTVPMTTYTNPHAGTNTLNVFSIGGRKHYDNSIKLSYPSACKFREILVYQGDMTEEMRIDIETYLSNKWDIDAEAPPPEPTGLIPDALTEVAIDQPATGDTQSAYYYVPADGLNYTKPKVPLVVALHSWSATYSDASRTTYYNQAKPRGWAMIHPNFRGANDDPNACASELAVDDVVRAVDFMKQNANIDPDRIYLVGASGGGHMALSVASRRPTIWAAVSAWVPITDLSQWYYESKSKGSKYYSNIVAACGGIPGASPAVDAQYFLRSPINYIQNTIDIPMDINTGIHDGHSGSVPISHTLNAFNKLADAKGLSSQKLSTDEINYMVTNQALPAGLATETVVKANEGRALDVLFRRTIGNSRVSVFEGGHQIEAPAAFKWFEDKSK